MAYPIPSFVEPGFKLLLSTPQAKIKSLISVLKRVPGGLMPGDLADYIANKSIYTNSDSGKIASLLYGLYGIKERETKSLNELIDSITDSLKQKTNKKLKPNRFFKEILKNLLTVRKLGNIYKAFDLLFEHDKTYFSARVITDIRPVFEFNSDKNIETSVIIHNLRIQYNSDDGSLQYFTVALDNIDLGKLREQLVRAIKKVESIKSNLKDSITITEFKRN